MMRNLLLTVSAVLALTIPDRFALALEPQGTTPAKPSSAQTTKPPTQPKASPNLSEDECTGLGGKVADTVAKICGTGRVCQFKDQNNTGHAVCIDAQ